MANARGTAPATPRPSAWLAALAVAVSATLLAAVGLFDPIEDRLTAARSELLPRQPSGDIAIVEIDARSLAELKQWPWPRAYHARVIDTLDKGGASVIAFDVDFSSPAPSGDAEMAAAIERARHVILPIFQQRASSRTGDAHTIVNRPHAAFRGAWVGGVNIFPDGDGLVRQYPAATMVDGEIQPSIAALVAEDSSAGSRTFQPDWAIEAEGIPRYSFVDVMAGRVPAAQIEGKKFIIGATAVELGDRYAVPRYGIVPGVVIQALAAESLAQHRAIRPTGAWATLLGALVIAFLLAAKSQAAPTRFTMTAGALLVTVVAGPIAAQAVFAVSIASAAWMVTLAAAIGLYAVVETRRRLQYRSQHDFDSGLPNRTMLETDLSPDTAMPVLATAAIERFEAIRDGIGLAATNDLVRKTAERIADTVGAPVYRLAPDMLAWAVESDDDEAMVDNVQSALRIGVETRAGPVDIALTVGIDRDPASAAVLRIERALAAIGTARAMGRTYDRYRGADPQLRRQLSMMSELRQAMQEGRLHLVYQPKLSLATASVGDVEALVRMVDGGGRTVAPDEFIPLAEETGVIRELTSFVLRAALSDLGRWVVDGLPMRVAVNVSAVDLTTPGFVELVQSLLDEYRVPPGQLALEVTENALIRSPAEAAAALTALRQLGVRLSVDDYGSGQSTLSYLKHLPVHEVKIDRSFVTNVAESRSDAIMVRSTIDMAHDLGLEVVAEGVEDDAALAVLREFGCDYAQGYLVGKPIAANVLVDWVSGKRTVRKVA
jgi:diguanylate cyclase